MARWIGDPTSPWALGIILCGFAVGCTPSGGNQDTSTKSQPRVLSEKARDSVLLAGAGMRHISAQTSSFLLANKYFNALASPLGSDKQAFEITQAAQGTGKYGPVVQAFPAQELDSYQSADAFKTGHPVAALHLDSDISVSANEPGYGSLGLSVKAGQLVPGDYCVYLFYDQNTWRTMTLFIGDPAGPTDTCAAKMPTPTSQWPPKVFHEGAEFANDNTQYKPGDLAPTVRFVEGKPHGNQPRAMYLAVRCGDQVCILQTDPGGGDVLGPGHGERDGNAKRDTRLWHDDQRLADLDQTGSNPVPYMRAAVIPDADLESHTPASAFYGTFVHAAVVEVETQPASAQYTSRFGLTPGVNDISILLLPPTTGTTPRAGVAMIKNSNGNIKYLAIERKDHSDLTPFGIKIPGTARWAWSPDDEQIWVRCDVGCCMIDPDITLDSRTIARMKARTGKNGD